MSVIDTLNVGGGGGCYAQVPYYSKGDKLGLELGCGLLL